MKNSSDNWINSIAILEIYLPFQWNLETVRSFVFPLLRLQLGVNLKDSNIVLMVSYNISVS